MAFGALQPISARNFNWENKKNHFWIWKKLRKFASTHKITAEEHMSASGATHTTLYQLLTLTLILIEEEEEEEEEEEKNLKRI